MAIQPDLYSGEVREALRRDAFDLLLGTTLTVMGLLAVAVFTARKRPAQRGLLWFGIFVSFYGIRLHFSADIFRFTAEPIPQIVWRYLEAAITYLIPLLGVLFFREIFPSWNRVLRWLAVGLGAFAGIGVVADQLLSQPASLNLLNNLIVIIGFVLLLAALYRYPPAGNTQALRAGVLIFSITVLIRNIWGLPRPNLPWGVRSLESLGFTCFLIGLGTVVARRLFDQEEQFIEINKELDIARRIQTSILPDKTPSNRLVSFATRYLAMTAVAGDFYDFLVVDENRIGILIADVSGHGVPAALIASMVKVAVSAQLPCAADPAQVLSGMNRILCGKTQSQYVTAAYLFLDLQNGLMRYSAAGHPALLYCEQTQGATDSITENGLMLGLFPSAPYSVVERKLHQETRFLLYTDGILEASSGTEQFFGEERVREALFDARNLSAEECAALLIGRVQQWTAHRQEDDLTVIVIDVHGSSANQQETEQASLV
jgi:sigma-B regulation protein RsbU (phosphoserine phosphatase)